MHKSILLLLLLVGNGLIAQKGYTVKSGEISFEFVDKGVKGTIGNLASTSNIDFDNPETSVFSGSVETETLDTNNGIRNWSLKNRKYFDADNHPKITFESNTVKAGATNWKVTGPLTIKGISKNITITFAKKGNQLIGTTELYCYDFDIKIKKKREDNLVKVKMVFELKS
ncbi:MAG: YceI family protein [Bacteroidota bacterium]